MKETLNSPVTNTAKTKPPMLKETQMLLKNFYKPLNKLSVQVMNDSRFYFGDSYEIQYDTKFNPDVFS